MDPLAIDAKIDTLLEGLRDHDQFSLMEGEVAFLKGPLRPKLVPKVYGLAVSRAGIAEWNVGHGGDEVDIILGVTVELLVKLVADEAELEERTNDFVGRVLVALSELMKNAAWTSCMVGSSTVTERTPQSQMETRETIQCQIKYTTLIN